MINAKAKGTKGERDLTAMFWEAGWAAIRSPGSGAARHPSPDIIAGTPERKVAIEAKVTKDKVKYLTDEEIEQLREFCEAFNAEPWVAAKFGSAPWLFMTIEDLEKTEKAYVIREKDARLKGLLFEELIGV
ncbi:MAG: Holliday junction resolvase Hjc [archaeon]